MVGNAGEPGGRIEPVDVQVEMQRSYLDYAMAVIVGRALPDVRDGFKPVHRRVLYAMYDGRYLPDRGYYKCSRVVGDVMSNYHPHSDTAIYDTLVRLGQWWSMRHALVDGQGNFGSRGDDKQAAMRYCVVGDTRVRTFEHGTPRITDLVPDASPNTEHDIDLKVYGRDGVPVSASKFFHSGSHPTIRMRTGNGMELTGTHNHPVLTLRPVDGVPTLDWTLLNDVRPGDVVVAARSEIYQDTPMSEEEEDAAFLLGAFVSEGFVSETRAGFNNIDRAYFDRVLDVYDRVVGGRRYVSTRTIASGSTLHELDVQDLRALRSSTLGELIGLRSADKVVPEAVWRASSLGKISFLQGLFTGDGSASQLPRDSVQVSYSTCSVELARGVMQLLLEQGVTSTLSTNARGEVKVVIGNRREVERFAERVGFWGVKQDKMHDILK